jgi:hypothetical protein
MVTGSVFQLTVYHKKKPGGCTKISCFRSLLFIMQNKNCWSSCRRWRGWVVLSLHHAGAPDEHQCIARPEQQNLKGIDAFSPLLSCNKSSIYYLYYFINYLNRFLWHNWYNAINFPREKNSQQQESLSLRLESWNRTLPCCIFIKLSSKE